jgi:hypothetical protein
MLSITEAQQQLSAIEKCRAARLQGHELRGKQPDAVTAAHDGAGGQGGVTDAEAAAKAYADRGIELGPDHGREPGHPQPADFDRGYLEQEHAARSPLAGPPRVNPMPGMTHRVLPDQPLAAAIPPGVIAHYTMSSPSERS